MPSNAQLARLALGQPAISPTQGDAQAKPRPIPRGRDHARSEFVDRMPGLDFSPAWFTTIAVANPSIAAGRSAWYKFGSIRVPKDLGQPVALIGLRVEMLPTDSAGTGDDGGADPLAWGTARGKGAAIVVGLDLPGAFRQWHSGPANVPGVETTGDSVLSPRTSAQYPLRLTFPPGKLNDTVPAKLYDGVSFKPWMYRIADGQTLDVSLVVRRSQIHAQTGNLYGLCSVTLELGLTRDRRAFGGV